MQTPINNLQKTLAADRAELCSRGQYLAPVCFSRLIFPASQGMESQLCSFTGCGVRAKRLYYFENQVPQGDKYREVDKYRDRVGLTVLLGSEGRQTPQGDLTIF